ncbi:molybdopterin-guanine dinucleotide biosynthesis protein B [Oceanibium sediminis]|uniref:molybdopterin-guanine dinucleotide biosynthesis protein B n=1 Tax=Oceanibium sediminis TaxID=2026339 RepID=UPI000DD4343C|nr:molybdopterin-guanine dinucleotide biosynthesis protein B [Oceanibium sediminis]
MKVFGVTGHKNMGKTTLVERLVAHFRAQGLSVSTIKHTHHAVDLEVPGTDTHRHRAAGAGEVILASGARVAILQEREGTEPEVPELLARLSPVDLVLIEGYKKSPHPKIEVWRPAEPGLKPPLATTYDSIIATAGQPVDGLAHFGADDIAGIAAFMLDHAEEVTQ